MITIATAKATADRTQDAYSFERYGRTEWRKAAVAMSNRGFNTIQIEAVLRSKWMRWAADAADAPKGKAEHLIRYFDVHLAGRLNSQLADLVVETFGDEAAKLPQPTVVEIHPQTGADLAGDCEGEDIADLIDLAMMVSGGRHRGPEAAKAKQILDRIKERAK